VLGGLDLIFTCLFTVELLLKLGAFGVYSGKHAYLRSGWNVLDFFVVLISWFSAILGFADIDMG